jgi:hypothetical protein
MLQRVVFRRAKLDPFERRACADRPVLRLTRAARPRQFKGPYALCVFPSLPMPTWISIQWIQPLFHGTDSTTTLMHA